MRLGIKVIMGCGDAIRHIVDKTLVILQEMGYDVTDASTLNQKSGDFADAAEVVAKGIQSGQYQRGVLFCGTGIGACMVANKFRGIRAGLAYENLPAALASMDYGANVLCTGAWMMDSPEKCAQMIDTWLLVGYGGSNGEWMERIHRIEAEREGT